MPENEKGRYSTDIFRIKYRGGLGNPQEGKYAVTAKSLDKNGNAIGGGFVNSFDSMKDAQSCVSEINGINPRHDAKISDTVDK